MALVIKHLMVSDSFRTVFRTVFPVVKCPDSFGHTTIGVSKVSELHPRDVEGVSWAR